VRVEARSLSEFNTSTLVNIRFVQNLLAFITVIFLSSCNNGAKSTNTASKINTYPAVTSGIIEVNGLCEKQSKLEPCPVNSMPKYYRQVIDVVSELRNRNLDTLSPFDLIQHYSNGFLIEENIGYKYVEGSGMPGNAKPVSKLEHFNQDATVYEVIYEDKVDNIEDTFGLNPPEKIIKRSDMCSFSLHEKNKPNQERVVVIQISNNLAKRETYECSIVGHLFYFGLQETENTKFSDYYEITTPRENRLKVKFFTNKILQDLQLATDKTKH